MTAVPEFDSATGNVEYDAEFAAFAIVCHACGFIRLHKLDLSVEEADATDGSNGAAG
jgi:hypothetical protein